ncbi:MAG: DUF63 family protein [Candidatus Altiarchaeota archaeon]|nr:DUF63 family protein [Candidatus Altiarchaeota archaeon]
MNWFIDRVWLPIFERQGYTALSTLFMAGFFVVLVEIYWRFAQKFDQTKFRNSLLPWILVSGPFRFLSGRLWPESLWNVTPGIFLLICAVFSALLFFTGYDLTRKIGYIISLALLLLSIQFLRFSALSYVSLALIVSFVAIFLLSKLAWMKDWLAWAPHVLESWISSFGVMAGLTELHILAGGLMSVHPILFGLVKTAFLPIIFWFLRDTEASQKTFLGTIILALGFGPGLRDLLELLSI